MRSLSQTTQFKKDIKLMVKRGKNLEKMKLVVETLVEGKSLEEKFRDHPLGGNWKGCRDCHVEPDWLLIYSIGKDFLRLERTGTHSDLFE